MNCKPTSRSLTSAASIAALVVAASAIVPRMARAQASPPVVPDSTVARTQIKRDTTTRSLSTVKIIGRIDDLHGVAATASEGRVGAVDLRLRPITREGEMLEAVPGVIVTQHSGEGKANQYFVRGFNLDHGTDFQTRVDGMPINLPTHAHGQGYTDLNFLMPEFVDYLDYKLGVYHAELGDFGSAGGAEFHLLHKLEHPFATASTGENGLARLAVGASSKIGGGDFLIGGEARAYNGPWHVAEEIRKFSALSRYSFTRGRSQFSLLAMAYKNQWNSNDQIPLRAVTNGMIDRFGQIDSTDGGRTQRYSLSGSCKHVAKTSVQDVQLFGIYSDLTLLSDFTYFLNDPTGGDQFGQHDHRVIVGGNAKNTRFVQALGVSHQITVGVQTRGDIITGNALYPAQAQTRTGTVRQDDVREWGSGVFAEAESHWTPWFRTVLGLRGDAYSFDVTSDDARNSGHRNATIASPKASLVFSPTTNAELYLSGGFGFHSNDARGTTITVNPGTGDPAQRVDPLARSRGAEAGFRTSPFAGARTTVSLWVLNLDSELLFTGDGGTTEPSAASRRQGITFANFYRPTQRIAFDADVSFARARFAGAEPGQTHVPGALESVVAGGVTLSPNKTGLFGALRVRHFGSYALIEDNSVRATATSLMSADLGYLLHSGVKVQLTGLNLLNARANDIQYYYASRLPGEPAGGVDDIHFHPVEPRQLRISLGWGF